VPGKIQLLGDCTLDKDDPRFEAKWDQRLHLTQYVLVHCKSKRRVIW